MFVLEFIESFVSPPAGHYYLYDPKTDDVLVNCKVGRKMTKRELVSFLNSAGYEVDVYDSEQARVIVSPMED